MRNDKPAKRPLGGAVSDAMDGSKVDSLPWTSVGAPKISYLKPAKIDSSRGQVNVVLHKCCEIVVAFIFAKDPRRSSGQLHVA